mgnify:CR=1 FL=1
MVIKTYIDIFTATVLILISDYDSWSWITTADNPHTLTRGSIDWR